MTVYAQIIQLLDKAKVKYQSLEHEPTPTCADAARVRGTSQNQGAKALVCFADKKPILVVLACSRKLDTKAFKRAFGMKDLRFATLDEVNKLTSLEIGAIPPLGSILKLPTYLDTSLGQNSTIAFNAGARTRSIIMKYADYASLEKPQISSFSAAAS